MKTLPDKPSDLIELALSDLEKVEKNPRYEINMSTWHTPDRGKCSVCLAGAVIAGTLEQSIRYDLSPQSFDENTRRKLVALDHFRLGYIGDGLQEMCVERPLTLENFAAVAPYYRFDRNLFKRDMREIIAKLRSHDL